MDPVTPTRDTGQHDVLHTGQHDVLQPATANSGRLGIPSDTVAEKGLPLAANPPRAQVHDPAASTVSEDFEAKYAGKSAKELHAAMIVLEDTIAAESDRIAKEYFDRGLFDEEYYGAGSPVLLQTNDGQGKVAGTFVRMSMGEDGSTTLKRAHVDPMEHPDLAPLSRELVWLSDHRQALLDNDGQQ